jgi:hypothetical protein
LSWLLPGVLLWAGRPAAAAAPPPPLPEPLKGAVTAGAVIAAHRSPNEGHVYALVAPLRGAGPARRVCCSWSVSLPVRWQAAHGAFWARWATSISHASPLEAGEMLLRLELPDLLRGRAALAPGTPYPEDDNAPFAPSVPANDDRTLCLNSEFEAELYSEALPAGPRRVRHFVLTNARGRLVPAGKTEQLAGFIIRQTPEERRTPVWSLTVHAYEAKWDKASRSWVGGRWQREESIEVRFREPFQVLGRGKGYYFVTRSGKLYRAPPAAKGKPRQLEAVWADRRRRIEVFLTDVDGGRTYLFCRPAKEGERPTFFELGPKPRPVPYDLAPARPGKRPEVLTRLLRYADTLVALKRLQLK